MGTKRIANQNKIFISYEEAKKIIINLNIKSRNQFRLLHDEKIKKYNIPVEPNSTYKNNGWTNWGDFLGTNRLQDNLKALNYLSYEESKNWIKNNLNILSKKDWVVHVKDNKIPNIIPNNPQLYYYKKNRGWKGWKDFLNKKIGKS